MLNRSMLLLVIQKRFISLKVIRALYFNKPMIVEGFIPVVKGLDHRPSHFKTRKDSFRCILVSWVDSERLLSMRHFSCSGPIDIDTQSLVKCCAILFSLCSMSRIINKKKRRE